MPLVRKFVHDENIRRFREKISRETDPEEIKRLEALIAVEESLYLEALRSLREDDPGAPKDPS